MTRATDAAIERVAERWGAQGTIVALSDYGRTGGRTFTAECDREQALSDALRAHFGNDVPASLAGYVLPVVVDPIVQMVDGLVKARNDLLAVANDYPGSSCQKWCTERAAQAWAVLKPWQSCPSTHCERAQECRSVNECSAEKSAPKAALSVARAIAAQGGGK